MWKLMVVLVTITVLLDPFSVECQTKWTRYAGNPVMNRGPSGAWDDLIVIPNRVILIQDTLKMWYSGSQTGQTFNIGYAWSTDRGITWTKHPANPIVTPTQPWEQINVGWPYLIFTGLQYKMWYLGSGSGIGYATSPDGIHWSKSTSNPLLTSGPAGSWDYIVSWPCVMPEEAPLLMWYEGWNMGGSICQIGHAIATNESTWTRVDTVNPVLKPVAGTWEPSHLRGPRVMYNHQGTYPLQMWYTGGSNMFGSGVGYAKSRDGTIWVKDTLNPVLAPGPSGSWDAAVITLGDVILLDDSTYQMWYTGSAATNTFAEVGFATAKVTTAIRRVPDDFPRAFALEQNYPNPFNPKTGVRFQVSGVSDVKITVYDLLGREVAVLVNERKAPGNYEVSFDGSGFASGVYIYRMAAGSYVQSKTMLLIK